MTLTAADILAAQAVLAGVVRDIPVAGARWLSDRVGGPVVLVPENLQRAGSFKIRGAYVRMSRLSEAERQRGVVAASAGNQRPGGGPGSAVAGHQGDGVHAGGATIPKVQATRAYGAEIDFAGTTIDEALEAAVAFAERTGAVLIHPFDHPDVVAGQGTLGLEILHKVPDVRTVVVCTGGGGLLAGVALAIKATAPQVRVVGVQAGQAAAYPPSLQAGHPVRLERMSTMADGIAVGQPGQVPFAHRGRVRGPDLAPSPRRRSRAQCCCWPSEPRWWSSRPGPRRRPPCWRAPPTSSRRWPWCSAAGTWTRSC
jgi:threonine dehydratase